MINTSDSDCDENAALEASGEKLAILHLHDILKTEQDRRLKGYPPDPALEKWGPDIEEMILRELQIKESRKPHGKCSRWSAQRKVIRNRDSPFLRFERYTAAMGNRWSV